MTYQILPYSTRVVKLTNHDFLSPGWKIAIGSLSTSALAALKIWLTASLEHHLEGSPEGTPRNSLYTSFMFYGYISYVFSFILYGSIEAITEAAYRWFHFLSTASVWLYKRVFTHLVHQPLVYAFNAPTTYLCVQCTNHLLVKHWLIRGRRISI